MPQTGEFHHYIREVEDELRRSIYIASLLAEEPPPSRNAVGMKENIDTELGVRHGAHLFVNLEQCSEEVRGLVKDVFTTINIPGITFDEMDKDKGNWRIDTSIKELRDVSEDHPARTFSTRPGWHTIFSQGFVTPLILELNDHLESINDRLTSDVVMPGMIKNFAAKIQGADAHHIALRKAPTDEHFDRRIYCGSSHASDPLWQEIVKEAMIVQRKDFTGSDLKFHSNTLQFEKNEREEIIAFTGPSAAIIKIMEVVREKLCPGLPSMIVPVYGGLGH